MTVNYDLERAANELYALGATDHQISRLSQSHAAELQALCLTAERHGRVRAADVLRYSLAVKRRAGLAQTAHNGGDDGSYEAYLLIGLASLIDEFRILETLGGIARLVDCLSQPLLPHRYEGLRHLYKALKGGPRASLYPMHTTESAKMWQEYLQLLHEGLYPFPGSFEQLRDQLYCYFVKYAEQRPAQPPDWTGRIVNDFSRLVASLTGQRLRVIRLRYGLDGGGTRSLAAVAHEMRLPVEKCAELHADTLATLAAEPNWEKLRLKLDKLFT